MTVAAPINWATVENAIYAWFFGATGITTIWADQSTPQPAMPFAVLKRIAGPTPAGRDEVRGTGTDPLQPTGQEVGRLICGQRDFTVSCKVSCASDAPAANADHYLGMAQIALSFPSMLETLSLAGVAVVASTPPVDLDFIADGAFRSCAAMDVRFRVAFNSTERCGYIGSVEYAGSVKDADDSTVPFGGTV